MRQLLTKLCVLTTLIAVSIGLLLLPHSNKKSYLASDIDKHHLLNSAQGPRIILVGGSNLAFGINSGTVSRAFGRPVINMGVNAALGLKYMLNEVQPHLREGDWVVLSPEYQQFYGHLLNGQEALGELMVIKPDYTQYLSPDQYLNTLSYSLAHLSLVARHRLYKLAGVGGETTSTGQSMYHRDAYNQWGDNTAHLRMQAPGSIVLHPIKEDRNHQAEELINQFTEQAVQKKASVFLVHPGYWKECYKINKAKIDALAAELPTRVKAKILSRPEDFLFDQSYLFDTEYHLNGRGIQTRTRKLIALLNRQKYQVGPGVLVRN